MAEPYMTNFDPYPLLRHNLFGFHSVLPDFGRKIEETNKCAKCPLKRAKLPAKKSASAKDPQKRRKIPAKIRKTLRKNSAKFNRMLNPSVSSQILFLFLSERAKVGITDKDSSPDLCLRVLILGALVAARSMRRQNWGEWQRPVKVWVLGRRSKTFSQLRA